MSLSFGKRLVQLIVAATASLLVGIHGASAFSMQRNDNMAVYWGQDGAGGQQNLGAYCNDDSVDTIPLAFLFTFFGPGGQPILDFANICGQGGNTFPGTALADCSFMASDIKKCQANGKLITLSLGGATANVGFDSADQAAGFANTIWNMFLGGNGGMRPFGSAVLDGVDLDIENGSAAHYDTFVNTLRSLAQGAPKRYYVTAAPQCPFPDAEVGEALNSAPFDAVYVQFYNNFCQTSSPSDFNFATWDNWAKTQSPNPNVKVYLGAPASPQAAGSGFVSSDTLIGMAKDAQQRFSSFGGVMLWDMDTSFANGQYHRTVKNAISNGAPSPPDGPNPSGPGGPPPPPNPTSHTQKPHPTTTSDPFVPPAPVTTGDPRASGRVQRPDFLMEKQAAEELPPTTTTAEATPTPTPTLSSRFFRL